MRVVASCVATVALLLLGALQAANAHQAGWLELQLIQQAPGRYSWHWATQGMDREGLGALQVRWPSGCRAAGEVLVCDKELQGRLSVEGLTLTSGVAHVHLSGENFDERRVLTSTQPGTWIEVPAQGSGLAALRGAQLELITGYWQQGLLHIWTGWDHLMFVFSLTALIGMGRALVIALTGFSMAHALTLAASTLDWVRIPILPAEACIALSIALVCAEALKNRDTLARRAPFMLAFAFGLVHGLGFASGLLEIGLPGSHAIAALLAFNLGIEAGQLGVVALIWLALRTMKRSPQLASSRTGALWVMGAVSAYWSLERVSAILTQET